MKYVSKSFQYGQHEFRLETGEIARQATAGVLASYGDTVVLVSVVCQPSQQPRDFLPLTVDFEEKTYAAGRIPGGFFKREGRPSEKAVLTCRLIDRPIRPLFPEGFTHEVQIVCTVMSVDPQIDPDIVAMIGTSAALEVSGIPFRGPIGAARVGYVDGEYVLNPSKSDTKEASRLDLVVAGTENAVLMVESEAKELNEAQMLDAVLFGHEQMQIAIRNIRELARECGTTAMAWTPVEADVDLAAKVDGLARNDIEGAYRIAEKAERQNRLAEIRTSAVEQLVDEDSQPERQDLVKRLLKGIEKEVVRSRILSGEPRIDGRDKLTVRPIAIRLGLLPRAHGSALFTRGETQAIVTATLGTERDSQIIDALEGEYRERFMLHYNFPPFSVGETGRMGSPKRREIGHGRLAKRGMAAVMPDMAEFPYSIRVVSEITESNGSSSMASVCGASLALMDAGVGIKTAVAGVAMGLIKEGERFAVLTDILGDEDHLGDMDFKVTGTGEGVTALQMDIKIDGITREIMDTALQQAKQGREHILQEMSRVITQPRAEMSDYAPRIITIKIPVEKIRDVIGKGGVTIRAISEETGAEIDISDDGTVKVASVDNAAGQRARERIEEITADVEVGKIYEGRVVKLMDFGAFVNILPARDGLVHISQISHERVENVSDILSEGDVVKVKVLEVDRQGRIRLSIKALNDAA